MKQLWCFLLFTFLCISVNAQCTIAIQVKDIYTGYAVPATIELQNTDTSLRFNSARVNTQLRAGNYTLNIYAPGYERQFAQYSLTENKNLNIKVLLTPLTGYNITAPDSSYNFYLSDEQTGLPIAGAQVFFVKENKTAFTNESGLAVISPSQFTDTDNPITHAITTDIEITKHGYGAYTFKDVILVKSTTAFQVQLGSTIKSSEYPHHLLNKSTYALQQVVEERDVEQQLPATLSREACNPGSTIRVGTNCNCTDCTNVTQVSLESYVQSGLDNEWISSWNTSSLCAGAIAYRSYGAWYINNPVDANYDIANTTCNQVWDATTVASCVAAANATAGIVLTNSSGQIFRSEYSAETNNHNCGDCFTGETPNWPCISDNVCCGTSAFGHGRGMCQWGSKRWGDAPNAKTYDWILNHYYNPGGVIVCGKCAPVANDNCGTAIPLNITANCQPTQGTLLCATDDNYPNLPTCDGFSNPAQRGVFYSFTANSNSVTITVDPTGSGGNAVDAVVTVYKGSGCTTLQEHACFGGGGNGGGVTKTDTITGLTPGNTYYIRVYDYGTIDPGFPEFSICATNAPVTYIEELTAGQLQLYPNPNTGQFALTATLPVPGKWELSIFSQLGQLVYSKKGEGQLVNELVNLTEAGLYLVRMLSGEKVLISKVTVN